MPASTILPTAYDTVAIINEAHGIYLVQHSESGRFYVKKVLNVFNKNIYLYLMQHPTSGIPRIIDLYEDGTELLLIEEYISGTTLSDLIISTTLTKESIIACIVELCDIVGKLHSATPPIIHRDIKPSNIMVTSYGNIVLLDYNAAKFFSEDESSDTMLLGTHGYAAPEQYGFSASSPQTDIFAIGILLRDMNSSLAEPCLSFEPIIDRCTQMNPSDRYNSVSELSVSLLKLSKKKIKKAPEKKSLSFLPPGFRTLTPWKMIIATISYLIIGILSLSLTSQNSSMLKLWLERIFCLIMLLSVVAGSFNYLNIHRLIPLTGHKNRFIRILGIVILDIVSLTVLFLALAIIETALSI